MKCNICGVIFSPIHLFHYVASDGQSLYDAYDCPACGSQCVAQERKHPVEGAVETKLCDGVDVWTLMECRRASGRANKRRYTVGEQIRLGKYTATCQKVTDEGAIFLLDQYLDKPYQMNSTNTNAGGYEASELRKNLVADFKTDHNFDCVRDRLGKFSNGDQVRIPTVGEFFGPDDYYEADGAEQWELMKIRKNRIADREGEDYEWGWLQNKVKESAADFALVRGNGRCGYFSASNSFGVRPVILLVK